MVMSHLRGGTLVFEPNDFNDVVVSGGGEYLYFGYWLHKPRDPRGMPRFSTFAGGMATFDVNTAAQTKR